MLADVVTRYEAAIQHFWGARASAAERQAATGRSDAGARSQVTGGLHMDELITLTKAIIEDAGCNSRHVHVRSTLELPGYYRPEKKWDILVLIEAELVAAIEFKAHVGPSFGNNANNRAEEAVGVSEDFWTAFREGRLGKNTLPPFVGYVFLLEDCPKVHTPVRAAEPHFSVDPVFKGASYAQRYEWLLRRLVLERKYQSACLTLATNAIPTVLTHPAKDLTFTKFAMQLEGHIQTFLRARSAP